MNWRVLWSGKQDGREVSYTHYTCVSGRARLLFRCPLLVAQSTSVEAGDVAGPNELSRLISLLSLCHGLPGQGFPKFNYCCRPLYAGRRHGRQRQHGFRFRISSLTGCSRGPLGYIPQAARCYIPLVPNHIFVPNVQVDGEKHDTRAGCWRNARHPSHLRAGMGVTAASAGYASHLHNVPTGEMMYRDCWP